MIHRKICGITNKTDATIAQKAGATMFGFIFYEKSTSFVTPVQAKAIVSSLEKPRPLSIGVFLNTPVEKLEEIVRIVPLDGLQLHGPLYTPETCRNIEVQVIRSFSIPQKADKSIIKQLHASLLKWQKIIPSIMFLLDTYIEGSEVGKGGTGKILDWRIASELAKDFPILLSGGLNPGNVQKAIKIVSPLGVDVKSGVEAKPGQKDSVKVRSFLNNSVK